MKIRLVLAFPLLLATAPRTSPIHARFAGKSPSIRFDAAGALHVAYVESLPGGDVVVTRTISGALTTSSRVSPAGAKPEARGEVGPALALLPNGDELVAYSADVPIGQWSSELRLQQSRDGGKTWSAPRAVHDDRRVASHSYADVAVNRAGDAVFSWLDDRSGHQGVRTAVVHGGTAGRNASADDFTCECCRTTLLAASDGSVWLAYRDHAAGDVRNIAYAISRDGGNSFARQGDVADDHWSVNGCPDSGPRMTEGRDGAIWATWLNGKTASIEAAAARGGKFGTPQVLASPSALVSLVNHPEIGTLPDGRLVVFYEANQPNGPRTIAMRVADEKGRTWSAPITVATDAVGPRFTRFGDHAALAFTQYDGSAPSVVIEDWRELVLK